MFDKKIKTDNLYCAELCTYKSKESGEYVEYRGVSFAPPKYTLVRKQGFHRYIDIFTGSEYKIYSDVWSNENGEIVVRNLQPISSTKGYITLEEAKEIFENKNFENEENFERKPFRLIRGGKNK
jgi:hypothetical protein